MVHSVESWLRLAGTGEAGVVIVAYDALFPESKGEFEPRFVHESRFNGCHAHAEAQAPQKIVPNFQIDAWENLMNLT